MSLTVYRLLHLFGVFFVLVSLAAIAVHAAQGGKKDENRFQSLFSRLHGLGLLIIVISGFGMLARLGIATNIGLWVGLKIAIWLFVGALLAVPYRKPELALPIAIALPFIAVLAAMIGLYKPI